MDLLRIVLSVTVSAQVAGESPRRAPDRHQSPTSPIRLIKEITIGVPDGPPEYAFGSITRMAVTVGGAFFTFDENDSQIRRYDATGKFVGPVGRLGGGPGEYRRVSGMALYGDSILLVFDPANGRIAMFDTTGVFRRSIAFNRGEFYGEKAFSVDRQGLVYLRSARRSSITASRGTESQYVRLRLDGTLVDSLPIPSEGDDRSSFVLMTTDGPRWNFSRRSVYTVLQDGGLLTANSLAYRLLVTPTTGAPRIIERDIPPVPITPLERQEWSAWARYLSQRGPLVVVSLPRQKPVIRDLLVDDVGRIWVSLYTTGAKRVVSRRAKDDPRPLLTIREANLYEVLEGDGTFLGRVQLPEESILLAVSARTLWCLSVSKEDVQTLTRYRIEGLVNRLGRH